MAIHKYGLAINSFVNQYKLLCKASCIIIIIVIVIIVQEHVLSGSIIAPTFSNFDMSGAIRGRKIIHRAVRRIRNVR